MTLKRPTILAWGRAYVQPLWDRFLTVFYVVGIGALVVVALSLGVRGPPGR